MSTPTRKRPSADAGRVSPPPQKRKLAGTTAQAMTDFFTPASQKMPDKTHFKILHQSLLVARHGHKSSTPATKPVRIASFDLDGTLIATKSGLTYPRNADDWRWWDPSVPNRLRELHRDGYALVVVTNQGSILLKNAPGKKSAVGEPKSLGMFRAKLTAVLTALDLPISLYAATGLDTFRKPRSGTWPVILEDHGLRDEDGSVDKEGSFYVGDAAGRAADVAIKVKKDHACSDRDFAANVGINFFTPEEFFRNEPARAFTRAFEPATYLESVAAEVIPVAFSRRHDVELVVFCGSPGAGKSTFYWKYLQPLGYERINQDILKTREKCVKVAKMLLSEGKSVAVDNTNAEPDTRAIWISLAAQLKVAVRLVHFTAEARLCEHNNAVRALSVESMNPEARTLLPRVAFSSFATRYAEPKLSEGFEDITEVPFMFNGTEEQKTIWRKYWV